MKLNALDQSQDANNLGLFTLLRGVPIKDYVKEAVVMDRETVMTMPREIFADQGRRLYPTDSEGSTYISNAFFQNNKTAMEKRNGKTYVDNVQAMINKSAEMFGITADLEEYNKIAYERMHKDYETTYAVEIELDGKEVQMWPCKTAEDFNAACNAFVDQLNKFTFQDRIGISRGLIEKSARFQVDDIPDTICKYAGMFYPDMAKLASELKRRKEYLKTASYIDAFDTMLEALPNMEDKEDVMKVAELIYTAERNDGLYNKPEVSRLLPDIVDVCFNTSPEKAASILNTVEMAGEIYHMDELQKISADKYKEAFGVDIDPSNSDALRDILPTMPKSDVELLKELTGVCPL